MNWNGAACGWLVATLALAGCDRGSSIDAAATDTAHSETAIDAATIDATTADGPVDDAEADSETLDVARRPLHLLLYTRTLGFRHASIPAALTAMRSLATERGWTMDATEDPARFSDSVLAGIDVVAFVLTSGDVLDAAAQDALQRFVARGGGFVGVHSSTDTEYDWPYYGALVGTYFLRHPAGTPRATLLVEDRAHPSTHHLNAQWMRDDEWYSFRTNPADSSPLLHVLATLDEDSYMAAPEFRMGDHPISWYLHVGGGRSWQTAMGHTDASYDEPEFRRHLVGGIEWAAGRASPELVLDEFNGASALGNWDPHGTVTMFDYTVSRGSLHMVDRAGSNQHLTRRGILLDPTRPYLIDALFTIPSRSANGMTGDLNSFCINFNVQGQAGSPDDLGRLYAHAMNLDLSSDRPGNGVMKWMGFIDGIFAQIPGGETPTTCCAFDREYRLRVEVNRTLTGATRRGTVAVTLLEGRRVREHFEVDYTRFPWQPDYTRPVRVGVNTHGTDWTMRDLRVRYLD